MINNANIQAAWITKLKATANITAVVSAVEIRENNWKGERFTYPNIRVKLTNLTPTTQNNNCQIFKSEVSILCFSEIKSSKQADDIAGVVATELWGKAFASGVVRFTSVNLVSVIPAYVPETDENSWVSEVNFSCLVQSA